MVERGNSPDARGATSVCVHRQDTWLLFFHTQDVNQRCRFQSVWLDNQRSGDSVQIPANGGWIRLVNPNHTERRIDGAIIFRVYLWVPCQSIAIRSVIRAKS